MITVPRPLLVALALAFSIYSIGLALTTLGQVAHPERIVVALVLFVGALLPSVLLGKTVRMPTWLAGVNVGVTLSVALLASSTLPRHTSFDYGTWYIGATGCLLTVTIVRKHSFFAWMGLALLTFQTIAWAGPIGITRYGLLGDMLWIAVAHVTARALARAMVDVRQFARAEREAVEWQAAQDAHHFERQVRLTQTSRVALPMLRRIADQHGVIDEADKAECRVLEQTIRDEIRGRRLLNEAVREQVIAARRRGAFVQVLDDGGLDDLDPAVMEPVLDRVAEAIAGVKSDRIVIRTAPKGSHKAVTVVGISTDPTAAALGIEDEDEDVDLWLELERPTAPAPAPVSIA